MDSTVVASRSLIEGGVDHKIITIIAVIAGIAGFQLFLWRLEIK
jgi:hypothetical protein